MILGGTIFLVGLFLPWLRRLGLGSLPGDFVFKHGNVTFYFPIMTSLLAGLVLSFLLWLFRRF